MREAMIDKIVMQMAIRQQLLDARGNVVSDGPVDLRDEVVRDYVTKGHMGAQRRAIVPGRPNLRLYRKIKPL